MSGTLPGIGHNQPSDFDALRDRVAELHAAANKWVSGVPAILNDGQAAKCADFLDQVRATEKALADGYKAENAPLIAARNVLKDKYDPQALVLATIKSLLTPKQTDWLQRERRRKEDEARAREAEARRIEEAAAIERAKIEEGKTKDPVGSEVHAATLEANAAQKREEARQATLAAERPRVAGNYGQRSHGLRTRWLAEVIDLPTAFVMYMDHPDVLALLTRLASADARGGAREIPGCRVYSEETSA